MPPPASTMSYSTAARHLLTDGFQDEDANRVLLALVVLFPVLFAMLASTIQPTPVAIVLGAVVGFGVFYAAGAAYYRTHCRVCWPDDDNNAPAAH